MRSCCSMPCRCRSARWRPSPCLRSGRTPTSPPASDRQCHSAAAMVRSEEHTSELQSLMRISYAVFCLKKKNYNKLNNIHVKPNKITAKQLKHRHINSHHATRQCVTYIYHTQYTYTSSN